MKSRKVTCEIMTTDLPMEGMEESLPEEFVRMSADDIQRRTKLLDNEIRVLREEH